MTDGASPSAAEAEQSGQAGHLSLMRSSHLRLKKRNTITLYNETLYNDPLKYNHLSISTDLVLTHLIVPLGIFAFNRIIKYDVRHLRLAIIVPCQCLPAPQDKIQTNQEANDLVFGYLYHYPAELGQQIVQNLP